MRLLTTLAVAAAVVLSGAAPASAAARPIVPPEQARPWSKVDPSLFGMHAEGLAGGQKFPGTLGGVRLWDNGVRWDQVQSARGEYDWSRLDTLVDTARASGASEILYVLGSTPKWAASHVRPDTYYYGGGTASAPAKIDYWRTWVRQVATRYKGRITSYQIWNEANLASFFAPEKPGHWKLMARLTDIAAGIVRDVDPKAKVVSASSTVIQGKKFTTESFFFRYLRSLRNRGVDLDAITVHLYPWTTAGPGGGTPTDRIAAVRLARSVMNGLGFGDVPLWDTEVNYGNNRDNGHPPELFGPKRGAAFLARTYLDALRYGVTKVFWYSWESHVMGISTINPKTGRVTAPGRAYFEVQRWLNGTRWGLCSDQQVTVCSVKRAGVVQYVVFGEGKRTRRVLVPRHILDVRQVCSLDEQCSRIPADRVIRVGESPLLLRS